MGPHLIISTHNKRFQFDWTDNCCCSVDTIQSQCLCLLALACKTVRAYHPRCFPLVAFPILVICSSVLPNCYWLELSFHLTCSLIWTSSTFLKFLLKFPYINFFTWTSFPKLSPHFLFHLVLSTWFKSTSSLEVSPLAKVVCSVPLQVKPEAGVRVWRLAHVEHRYRSGG